MNNTKNQTPDNYLRLEFDALSINGSLARSVAAAFILPGKPTLETVADVRTAVSEAVTNCVVHAYRQQPGRIVMECELYGDLFVVTVSDRGCGIENLEEAMQPFYSTDTEGERSGMGFAVMKAFMDDLIVESRPGYGTKVTMKKLIRAAGIE